MWVKDQDLASAWHATSNIVATTTEFFVAYITFYKKHLLICSETNKSTDYYSMLELSTHHHFPCRSEPPSIRIPQVFFNVLTAIKSLGKRI